MSGYEEYRRRASLLGSIVQQSWARDWFSIVERRFLQSEFTRDANQSPEESMVYAIPIANHAGSKQRHVRSALGENLV